MLMRYRGAPARVLRLGAVIAACYPHVMPVVTHRRTIASHFVREMLGGAERRGENIAWFLDQVGISPPILDQPRARVPFEQVMRLLQLLWQHLDDELMGFTRRPLPYGSFAMMCCAVLPCVTLRHALQRANRFYKLVQGGRPHMRLVGEGERASIVMDESDLDDPDHLVTVFMLIAWHRFCCWLIGQHIPLTEVRFSYGALAYSRDYDPIFAAPLHFRAGETALCFAASYLEMPLVQDESSLDVFLHNSAHELLWRREHGNRLGGRIRRMLGRDKEGAALDLDTAAKRLKMSPQTLRRHLHQEGSSFLQIKDHWRRDLAISLLAETTLAVAEIARRTGFSEPSTFHRAFKKWTGVQPSAYRG
jgi:AraC-like DNA-binding protein